MRPRAEIGAGRAALRRLLFGVLVVGMLAWALVQSHGLLAVNGLTALELAALCLSAALFAPLSVGFWIAVIGALVRLRGDASLRTQPLVTAEELGGARTALVMPVYNEDPERVFAGLLATWESLERTGLSGHFDLHVLSDTTDPEVWLREELAFVRLRERLGDARRLHYRNRPTNEGRKAGNIAEFCARRGADYRYMVVLDADSVLSGSCVVNLVRAMELHPGAGILQAPPVAVNRRTLFGRLQQFGTRLYGTDTVLGLDFWQAGDGNYWGHNAILRVAPFVEHCELPVLPGREPLGGPILSHDFVEAALMVRAGWKVHLAPEIDGSYEETPPSLVDHAARDRRWCQGNLQHLRLLAHPGLNWVSRVHLALGALAYLAAPLWLLLLAVGTVEALRQGLRPHEYFPGGDALFPVWRVSVLPRSLALLTTVAALLFLPKLLGLAGCLRERPLRRAFGGARRLLGGAACEALTSVLLAPVLALLQARFVVLTLLGRKVEWNAQERGERGTSWGEAVRRHGGTTLLGAFWTAAVAQLLPSFLPWLAPVLLGLLLAIPLSVVSSRVGPGQWLHRHGLLCTPEELEPPRVLARLRELLDERAFAAPELEGDALAWVLADGRAREAHLELGARNGARDPLEAHALAGLCLKRRLRGPQALTRAERRALLLDAASVRGLTDGRDPA